MQALSVLVFPIVFLFATSAFAYNGQDPLEQGPMTPDQVRPEYRPRPVPGHSRTLAGRWILTDRMCSSGAVPQDGFRIGRDHYEFQLTRTGYRSYLRTGRCEQWSEGTYRVDRTALHFYVHGFNSTCPAQSPREFHYSYRMHESGALSVLMGPSRGPGSCSYGEFLESVFERERHGGGGHQQEPPEDQDPGPGNPPPQQPPVKPLF